MKKCLKKFGSLVLAFLMIAALCPQALAVEDDCSASQTAKNHVTFSSISSIAAGESLQQNVFAEDGTEAVVGIERISISRASGETWRVWYKGINSDVEFYMTVVNNKVTSVYDYSITLFVSTYRDAELTKTSTYGKLTFTHVWIGGSGTCWLKGTVTGEDDQIEVTWQM